MGKTDKSAYRPSPLPSSHPPVCPKVTSVTVPPQLFSGSIASLYLSLDAHPSSALTHPLIIHDPSGSTPSSFIDPYIATHSDFVSVTVSYSFSVPLNGSIRLRLDSIPAPSGSGCQAADRDVDSIYTMNIVNGMLGGVVLYVLCTNALKARSCNVH